jgi:hypothetical protein
MNKPTNTLSKKIRSYDNPNIKARWDMAIYIATNEQNLSSSRKILERPNKTTQDTICHIGLSGYYNFDIAYWRKTDHIIIIDINPGQVKFLKSTLSILIDCPTRKDFVDEMIKYMHTCHLERSIELNLHTKNPTYSNTLFFCHNVSEDKSFKKIRIMESGSDPSLESEVCQIMYELTRPGSWLSTDASYAFIKKMASQDRVAIFCEDFMAINIMKQLGFLLKTNHIAIDTLYLSNAYDWAKSEEKKLFNQSIQALIEPHTLIIEADQKTDMHQYIISGKKFMSRLG